MITVSSTPGIEGRVLRRGDEGYEHHRIGTCWHARVPARYPEVIVVATSQEDVVGAVQLARRENLGIAVRSGGHSWSASHLRDGTVLIDLSNMRRMEIDPEAMTATIQPGLKGAELSGQLLPRGLYFPTGHGSGVGLGGYLLQGGFAWNGRDYGPACMSVIGIDVVVASGELLHADENENSELLWAARGAGPGFFGVVTKFYLRLYPRKKVTMVSSYQYPVDCLQDVMRFVHEVGRETWAEITLICSRQEETGGDPAVMLRAVTFTDTVQESLDVLAVFESCPVRSQALSADVFVPTDHISLTEGAGGGVDENKRWIADNVTTHASADEMWPTIERMLEDFPPAPSHLAIFNWAGRTGEPERPAMAFSIEDEFFYSVYLAWPDADDDERYISWVTDHMRSLEPHATGTFLADENLQHRPSRFVSDDNLANLDALRSEWDPDARFVSWLGRPLGG